METQEQNNYFIMFPSYLLDELNAHECVLMGVLISLSKKEGYAYPSNQMLSDTLKTSIPTIGRMLSKLEESKHIIRKITRDKTGQIISRQIYIQNSLVRGGHINSDNTLLSEMSTPLLSNLSIPSYQNREHISITDNITSISKKDNISIEAIFDIIWNKYQKRGNRKTSFSAFKKLNTQDMKSIVNHIPQYVEAHVNADKMQFLPHLSTYINQRRWEDQMPYQDGKINLTKELINWNE